MEVKGDAGGIASLEGSTLTFVFKGLLAQTSKKKASPVANDLRDVLRLELIRPSKSKAGLLCVIAEADQRRTRNDLDPMAMVFPKAQRIDEVTAFLEKVIHAYQSAKPDAVISEVDSSPNISFFAASMQETAIGNSVDESEPSGKHLATRTEKEPGVGLASRALELAKNAAVEEWQAASDPQFEGFRINARQQTFHGPRGRSWGLAEVSAEVSHGATRQGRVTGTRLITGAVIGGGAGAIVGASAKKERSTIYLEFTVPGDALLLELKPKDERKAREFALKVNAAASQARTAAPAIESAPPAATLVAHPAPDLADQLTKLAALRDQGILTDDEFAAQKAKLLGT